MFFKSFVLSLSVFSVLDFLALKAQALSKLYVTSLGSDEVLEYNGDTGELLGTFISSRPELDAPDGFVFGPDGNVYVSGFYSDNVVKYSNTGEFLGVFASNVDGAAQLLFDPDGNLLVASYGDEQTACNVTNSCTIQKFDGKTGVFQGIFASNLNGADGLTIGPDGNLYASAFLGNQILKYDIRTGELLSTIASGSPLNAPDGLAFGKDGNLYATNWNTNEILKFDTQSESFLGVFASGGGLSLPPRLAFGLDNNLYVSSLGSNAVLKYDGKTGAFLETFISGVSLPTDLVFITVPEPGSMYGLLMFGALGGLMLKRKQRQNGSM